MMKDILRLGLTLLIISAVATGILAWVNGVTIVKINDLKAQAAIDTRKALMPDAASFDEKKAAEDTTFVYYIARNDKGEVLGYSFVAARRGYSSVVKSMVALGKDMKITNMIVFEQSETPGLGTLSQEKSFPDRFSGKGADELKVDKDGGIIKSLTGATITTRAITNSIREGIQMLRSDLEAAKPESAPGAPQSGNMDKKAMLELKHRLELMPAAKSFDEVKAAADTSFKYFIAKDDQGNVLGYTFIASQKGYSSIIKTLVAVDKNLNILNIKVLKQDETPGLGSLCQESDFPPRFVGKNLKTLKSEKDGGTIKCITGCTITTRAVINAVRSGLQTVSNDLAAKSKGGKA